MEFMVCIRGVKEDQVYLNDIDNLGAGIELGSYGLIGVKSSKLWNSKFEDHKVTVDNFFGKKALHGPFIGMEYTHIDYLIRKMVQKRVDMIFDAACKLNVMRVILHSGHGMGYDAFHLNEEWLKQNIEYWKNEISRWENAGIEVVLENETENNPDLLTKLVETVNNNALNLCLDIGHSYYFSNIPIKDWIKRMGRFLKHVHVHDNDQRGDHHWSIGKGTFDFEAFYAEIENSTTNITLSIEVGGTMEEKISDLRKVISRFKNNYFANTTGYGI